MQTTRVATNPPASSPEVKRLDLALWAGILVPLHAAGLNTIVGFSVAHHTCNANHKTSLVMVSILDLLLALGGGALAAVLRTRFRAAPDEHPNDGRRLFMANMGVMVSGLCALVILAGLIATIVLDPCD